MIDGGRWLTVVDGWRGDGVHCARVRLVCFRSLYYFRVRTRTHFGHRHKYTQHTHTLSTDGLPLCDEITPLTLPLCSSCCAKRVKSPQSAAGRRWSPTTTTRKTPSTRSLVSVCSLLFACHPRPVALLLSLALFFRSSRHQNLTRVRVLRWFVRLMRCCASLCE